MNSFGNASIVFVCQKGEIETKSLLLAYSLRKVFGDAPEIIAVIPEAEGYVFEPDKKSLEILDQLMVKTDFISNDFLATYQKNLAGNLVSNKIYALGAKITKDFFLLLDSDILCLNPQEWKFPFFNADLVAKQANRCEITRWERIYQLAGLTMPAEKYRCTVDNHFAPLYLNSGVLWMKSSVKKSLFDPWEGYFKLLSNSDILGEHLFDPFFRDQVALSLAIRKLSLQVHVSGENLNYPMRVRLLKQDRLPLFAHYHDIPTLMGHPFTRSFVISFIDRFDVLAMFYKNETWRKWVEAGKLKLFFLRAEYKIPRTLKPLMKKPLQRLKVIVSRLRYKTN